MFDKGREKYLIKNSIIIFIIDFRLINDNRFFIIITFFLVSELEFY